MKILLRKKFLILTLVSLHIVLKPVKRLATSNAMTVSGAVGIVLVVAKSFEKLYTYHKLKYYSKLESGYKKDQLIHDLFYNRTNIRLAYKLGLDINVLGEKGDTLLTKAVFDKNLSQIQFLLKHQADVNVLNKCGETPLELASYGGSRGNGDRKIMELLISAHADLNQHNSDGETLLTRAVRNENLNQIKFLLSHRVNVNTVNKRGEAPLELAMTIGNCNNKIVKLLLGAGSSVNGRAGSLLQCWALLPRDIVSYS